MSLPDTTTRWRVAAALAALLVLSAGTCSPVSPPPVPPPRTLGQGQRGDVGLSLYGGYGHNVDGFDDARGGGAGMDFEARMADGLAITVTGFLGRGPYWGDRKILASFGAGALVFLPWHTEHFVILEPRMDFTSVHHVVSQIPSLGLTAGKRWRIFEISLTARGGASLPIHASRIKISGWEDGAEDDEWAAIQPTGTLEAGLSILFHVRDVSFGPFGRFVYAKYDEVPDTEGEVYWVGGGVIVRYDFSARRAQ